MATRNILRLSYGHDSLSTRDSLLYQVYSMSAWITGILGNVSVHLSNYWNSALSYSRFNVRHGLNSPGLVTSLGVICMLSLVLLIWAIIGNISYNRRHNIR